jgi:hypothetical protein
MAVKSISITSEKNTGRQILKDYATPTEKKIIVQMLNAGMTQGKVRNKVFKIEKIGNQKAKVTIYTTTKSVLLGRDETIKNSFEIKYS